MTTEYVPSQFQGNPTVAQLNAEFVRIRNALDNTFSRVQGVLGSEVPFINQLELDLDLNDHELLNVRTNPEDPNSLARIADIPSGLTVEELTDQTVILIAQVNDLQSEIDALPDGALDAASQTELDSLTLIVTGISNQINTLGNSLGDISALVGSQGQTLEQLGTEFGVQVNAINQRIVDLQDTIDNLPAPNTDAVSQTVFDTQVGVINQSITALQTMLANLPPSGVSQADFDVLAGEFGTQVNAINQSILALQTTVDGLPTDGITQAQLNATVDAISQELIALEATIDDIPTDTVSQADFDVLAGEFGTQVNAINQNILALQESVGAEQRAFSFEGELPSGEVVAQWVEGIGFDVEQGVTTGFAIASTAPSGGNAILSLSISVGGFLAEIATAIIPAGSTTGTVSFSIDTTIAPGTPMVITAGTQNGAEDVALTFVFNQE